MQDENDPFYDDSWKGEFRNVRQATTGGIIAGLICFVIGLHLLVFLVGLLFDAISYIVGFQVTPEDVIVSILLFLMALGACMLVPITIFQIIEGRRAKKREKRF